MEIFGLYLKKIQKFWFKRTIFSFAIVTLWVIQANSQINIAVNDLRGEGIPQTTARIITDRLRNELFKSPLLKVSERSQLEAIMKELGFQQSGACNEKECLVEAGKFLGVSQMITGSIGKVGSLYTINIRVVDVSSGVFIHTVSSDCRCTIEEVLSNTTTDLAKKLIKSMKSERFCSLNVSSKPSGAKVSLNKTNLGITPVTNDTLPEMKQAVLKLSLDGFEPVTETISLLLGESVSKSYILKRPQSYLDSVERAEMVIHEQKVKEEKEQKEKEALLMRKKRIKRKVFRQVVIGTIGAALSVGGIYADSRVAKYTGDMQDSYNSYMKVNSDFGSYRSEYDAAENDARKWAKYRNILYTAGSVFGVAFVLSIPF